MTRAELFKTIDHTLLKPQATWEDVRLLCDEGKTYGTASVCISPLYVRQAAEYLGESIPVCTVIGFPLGTQTTATKVFEVQDALAHGAEEFDMVISIGHLKSRNTSYLLEEIKRLKNEIPEYILKVIVETALLTLEEKKLICQIVAKSGADYIKTSTGFSTGGATFEDVALFQQELGGACKIKAAGGISTVDDMKKFLSLGASRLGTSQGIRILTESPEYL